MTKEKIIGEIRRTAVENGNVPLGKERFLAVTGIRESDWSGRFWVSWAAAVREAGFEPQKMNQRLADEVVLEAASRVVRQLGHFPTAVELRLATRSDKSLPSHNTYRRFGGLAALRTAVTRYAAERGLADLLALLPEARIESLGGGVDESPDGEEDLQEGFVYLIKSGRHYKIGKANSVAHRARQLAIQLPERAVVVHRIANDDAFGIERYWHRRFEEKRLNGEWFALSVTDVKAFRRRRFM